LGSRIRAHDIGGVGCDRNGSVDLGKERRRRRNERVESAKEGRGAEFSLSTHDHDVVLVCGVKLLYEGGVLSRIESSRSRDPVSVGVLRKRGKIRGEG